MIIIINVPFSKILKKGVLLLVYFMFKTKCENVLSSCSSQTVFQAFIYKYIYIWGIFVAIANNTLYGSKL